MPADTSWTFDPGPIAMLVLLTGAYVYRWRRTRAEAGRRHRADRRAASGWRLASFLAGITVLAVALVSPVDRLGEQAFVMHMTQHVLLIDVAAILLILGLTKVILRPVTRRVQTLEERAGPFGHPVFAICAYVAVMWAWHVPAFYDAALEHSAVHALEHITFMSAGLLYWWHLLGPIRSRHRTAMGPVVYMLSTKLLVGLLGIAITFAPDAVYDYYKGRDGIWGLTADVDQELAGALMALEQSIVMGIALAWLFVVMLGESQRNDERTERYGAT